MRYLILILTLSGLLHAQKFASPEETKLVPPSEKNCLFIPLTGYTASEKKDSVGKQIPLFKPFDVNDDWWDNILAEQLQARVPVTMAFTRGADKPGNPTVLSGVGNMNPYRLDGLVEALKRAKVTPDLMKVACFSDTAPYGIYQKRLFKSVSKKNGGRFDWAHQPNWDKVLWETILEPFFDTIPKEYWFRVGKDNRPFIRIWGLNPGANTNHQGNLSQAITRVADLFEKKHRERPIFAFSLGERRRDTTLENHPDLYAFGMWFGIDQEEAFTFANYQGTILGGGCPGYHGPSQTPRILPRRDGKTLRWGLEEALRLNASHTIIEGWKNSYEGVALFRSEDPRWPLPNTYINTLRRYTDPDTPTIRLEAEGCDRFVDKSKGNSGGKFRRTGDLDIIDMPDSNGWCVSDTEKGEQISHEKVYFSQGRYRLYLRYSSKSGAQIQPVLASKNLPKFKLPSTGSLHTFKTVAIGEAQTKRGERAVKLKFLSSDLHVDWFFVRKL